MVTFILFVISVSVILFLIGKKVAVIRNGNIPPIEERSPQERLFSDFDFNTWKEDTEYYVKIYGHRFVLYMLKQWIRFSFWIKEQKEKRFPKKEILVDGEPRKSPFTQFVDAVSEYKDHLKHVAKKVKEREERKRE